MRITDGTSKEISIGRDCETDRWNTNAGRMYGTKEDAKLLNAYLDVLQTEVYEVRRQMLESDEIIMAEALKNTLRGTNEKSKMIMVILQDPNDQMKSLADKDYSPTTLKR